MFITLFAPEPTRFSSNRINTIISLSSCCFVFFVVAVGVGCGVGTGGWGHLCSTLWLSLQELDVRYAKAQVLLSAVKEKATTDKNMDAFIPPHRQKKVSESAYATVRGCCNSKGNNQKRVYPVTFPPKTGTV